MYLIASPRRTEESLGVEDDEVMSTTSQNSLDTRSGDGESSLLTWIENPAENINLGYLLVTDVSCFLYRPQ